MGNKAISISSKTVKFIGASTDTKPTMASHDGLPEPTVGSTYLEYNTGIMYVTYDGTNWVTKGSAIETVKATKTLECEGGYSAGDVMSEDDDNGDGTDWDFAFSGIGYITKAIVEHPTNGLIASITIFLFSSAPTSELDDNAANTAPIAADVPYFIGTLDGYFTSKGSGSSYAIVTPGEGNIPLMFDSATLYAIVVTNTGFDPGDDTLLTIHLSADIGG